MSSKKALYARYAVEIGGAAVRQNRRQKRLHPKRYRQASLRYKKKLKKHSVVSKSLAYAKAANRTSKKYTGNGLMDNAYAASELTTAKGRSRAKAGLKNAAIKKASETYNNHPFAQDVRDGQEILQESKKTLGLLRTAASEHKAHKIAANLQGGDQEVSNLFYKMSAPGQLGSTSSYSETNPFFGPA